MTQHLFDNIELLFESSWEVCNKIGGIYTVLSTKANVLKHSFGDKLIFVGPDVWSAEHPSPVFIHDESLLGKAERNLVLPYGITVRTGRWDIPGQPIAVLVKFDGVYPHLDEIFGMMWEKYRVDSLHAYGDYNEGCAFGIASAIVMGAIARHLGVSDSGVLGHFDEWTTAMGLLYLQINNPCASTVFTTHATSIGRSICGNGKPLYDYFDGYHGDQMAAELNMQSKHSLEKAAAHAADCFTTVSEVTARECKQLLDIEPQVVTPNGFEPDFVPGKQKYNRLRSAGREKLLKIAEGLTGRTFAEDTFIVATSGRNEYRNKGIDLYIDACVKAREEVKPASRDILALILVPGWVKGPSTSLLDNMARKSVQAAAVPSYMTHLVNNPDEDSTTVRLSQVADNNSGSMLTIVDIPCYLDGDDGVLNVKYYDLLPALDLTVFASYYEPWGYTPLESIAFGVPTLSTDKAGFGQWILSNYPNTFEADGAYVIPRTDSNYDMARDAIADNITTLAATSDEVLATYRAAASRVSADADWAHFISYYDRAFEVATARRTKRIASSTDK